MKTKLDKYFRISQRGSTIGTELIGGATTFATMAYILAYMTGAMSAVPGIDLTGVLLCTALITAISCIAMGLVANAPIALAPVLVIPNLVAGMVASGEATYGQAFGTVAISGIVFLLISVFKLRDLFARSLPKNIKIGIGGAVGLLIASIGLNTSGLAAAGEDGSFINFSDKSVQLGLIGLAIALLLTYLKITVNGRTYKIKGALLISIVLTTIIGIPMGVTVLPENIFTRGALASIGNVAFQVDILGALKLSFVPFIIMLLINDFFGTLGTGLAMAGKAGLLDEDGNFPAFGKVFLVDSSATILGSLFGITTVSCFAESAAGVESGSRTGLSNLSTAFFFLLCMLFSPLFLMIPGAATGSALIVVGISMLETLRDVDFSGSEFLPVAVMLLVTAYKGDYVAGIALGMFTYTVFYFLITARNRGVGYEKSASTGIGASAAVHRGQTLAAPACRAVFPGIQDSGLSGAGAVRTGRAGTQPSYTHQCDGGTAHRKARPLPRHSCGHRRAAHPRGKRAGLSLLQ